MTTKKVDFYISSVGNDNWSGTIENPAGNGSDGPFATITKARDAIRAYKAENSNDNIDFTVNIADGNYELTETLLFTPEDSGTTEYPIRYVAAYGASPVISGGRQIKNWQEIEHNGLRCWIADLPDVASNKWNFTRLYINNTPRQRPRLPENGFYHFTGVDNCEDTGFKWCHGPDRANFANGDIKQWHNWQDVDLISYQLWFDTHHKFKKIDEENNVVHFQTKSLGSLRDERGDFARYFVENIFEALDTAGEWYLDRTAGRLYYLPLPVEKLENTVITAPALTEIIRIQGTGSQRVSHINFENINFAYQHWELPSDCPGYIQAAFGVPGAIILEGAQSCVFYGCSIAHVNGYGLEILAGSTENVIAACTIYDTGGGGVKIGHEELLPHESPVGERMFGDYPASATTVVDCTIRDCGHIFPSAIGIWVGNSGWNRLQHNQIFNCNYTGISCGWTWGYAATRTVCNLIENNHIHHINHKEILSDNGGIYTLGQQPGTVLRGNVIHNISCYGYGAWGIYPDEGSSEMLVENNLVYGTKKASYSTHYGRDNIVRNNIFAVSQDDHLCLGKREQHRSTTFRNNIVVTANSRIQGGAWDVAQYTVENNLYWSLDSTPVTFNGKSLESLMAEGQNIGAIVADPLFSDTSGGDFSLRYDSPAKNIGFKPFNWHAAGQRMTIERPMNYHKYLQDFPLPTFELPVIRTKIELLTKPADSQISDIVEFSVSLINVGRAPGKGCILLKCGPAGIAVNLSKNKISYDLKPGEEKTDIVTLNVVDKVEAFWLDSEPDDNLTVPARTIIFDFETDIWKVHPIDNNATMENIPEIFNLIPPRIIKDANRVVADVKLGANEDNLLLYANFYETDLRPNILQPWTGTAFELLSILPSEPDAPVDHPQPKCQIFLVPNADGNNAAALVLEKNECIAAIDIKVSSKSINGGCELTAIIPWYLLGYDKMPVEVPFELIIDCVDTTTGNITQLLTFNLPSDGWKRLYGKLIMG
ncbi:MAG: right-handed parallel beta-helix repeat-containing protein [bacterium]